MSDFTQLTVVSFFGLGAFFGTWYIARVTNEMGDSVLTGFIGNNPIATKDRWLILYNRFVPSVGGVVSLGIFVALATMTMANHVGDADTKLLAYLLAFLALFVSVTWLVHGVSMVVSCRSLLREGEAD
jgi:1,4-dihydroxy-2-naphthoate octaprenyltransferase